MMCFIKFFRGENREARIETDTEGTKNRLLDKMIFGHRVHKDAQSSQSVTI